MVQIIGVLKFSAEKRIIVGLMIWRLLHVVAVRQGRINRCSKNSFGGYGGGSPLGQKEGDK